MIPPHARPRLDAATDLIVRPACWCDPVVTFEEDMNADGLRYVYPHTWHRDDAGMPMLVASGDSAGRPPA